MGKRTHHKNALVTAAICFLAYGAVFVSVNADKFTQNTNMPRETVIQKSATIDAEARFDEEYFNSPQVNRAMTLDSAEPYSGFYPDSDPELRSI